MEKWRVQQRFNLTDEQFDNVVKKNAYSKEDEMKLIDECIEMIKKEM